MRQEDSRDHNKSAKPAAHQSDARNSGSGKIIPFTWDHVPDSTSWILNIAFPSGNQMDMAMENGLPRNFTIVNTNVEALDFKGLQL
jgi:hypothetical protein